MNFKNTQNDYGLIARCFHWASVWILFGLVLLGLYMDGLPKSVYKYDLYNMHKSFGLLLLVLVVLRIVWRLWGTPPDPQGTYKSWEKILAKSAQYFLYFLMMAIPLSGWVMSSGGGHPIVFFGLDVPPLIGKDMDMGKIAHDIHQKLPIILIVVMLLHVLGAFKHHFMAKDRTLKQMIAKPLQRFAPYILLLLLGLFVAGVIAFKTSENYHKPPVVPTVNGSMVEYF